MHYLCSKRVPSTSLFLLLRCLRPAYGDYTAAALAAPPPPPPPVDPYAAVDGR